MSFEEGHTPWNKGKKMTKETKAKISQKLAGRKAWNKGIAMSAETKAKISRSKQGQPAWNKGIKWSKDVIEKIKASLKAKREKEAVKSPPSPFSPNF